MTRFPNSCFERTAGELGLEPHVFHGSEAPSVGALLETLWARGITGLYLRPDHWKGVAKELPQADWSRFSVVMEGHSHAGLRFHRVRPSPFAQMLETLSQTFALGYQRVGVLLSESGPRGDTLARLGAALAFRQSELPPKARIAIRRVRGSWKGKAMEPAIRKWVHAQGLEALIVHPHFWYGFFVKAGWRIPQDISLATDESLGALNGLPPLAGCEAAGGMMGRRAAHLLFRLLRTGERGMPERPLEEVHEPQWLSGATLGLASADSAAPAAGNRAFQDR